MLEKNPKQRILSDEALNHPAFTIILSQSPLSVRNVFDNKDLIKYNHITEEHDQKKIEKRTANNIFKQVPDRFEDMSPTNFSQETQEVKNAKMKFKFPASKSNLSENQKTDEDRISSNQTNNRDNKNKQSKKIFD